MTEAFQTVNVRYMVDDVPAAVDWYAACFGFRVAMSSPAFGMVELGNLKLLLSGKASSAGRPMPDGRLPEPGGWAWFQVITADIAAEAERLKALGVTFRNEILSGPGGSQVLIEDPAGNVVELFQPAVAPVR